MKIFNTFDCDISEPCIFLLGNFDGFHLGHQALLNEAKKIREKMGFKILLFSFHENTKKKKVRQSLYLLSELQKIQCMKEYGVDYYVTVSFSDTFKMMSAENFLKTISEKFQVKHIVLSSNHHFGYNRQGNSHFLREKATLYSYEISVLEPLKYEKEEISSTRIRKLIMGGNIAQANQLLGRNFSMDGYLTKGKSMGKQLGFPTINLELSTDYVLPKYGVYASQITVGQEKYQSITNIGSNPTFHQEGLHIETYILKEFDSMVNYNDRLTLELIEFIREEKTFANKETLVEQIRNDVFLVKKLYE